ncbi:ion transporter [Radicibacter daui]|uniref:ion transporter n=1 Tax=Radicibacter daui TaxID=3064829 RepID=UPI00404702F0
MSVIEKLGTFVESRGVQKFIIWVIVLNAAVLGLETSRYLSENFGELLTILDHIALVIFIGELLAKILYRRLRFFTDAWNVFDFIVVGIALVPSAGPLSVLRALRVIRLLRLLSVVPTMRVVVGGLFRALPGMASIASLILLIFYVGAVLTTKLYGADFPDWFGTIGASMYSLFQIMTLESWSMGIVRPVMEVHPSAWVFFVPFIMVTTFAVLNLFVGTVVSAMQTEGNAEQEKNAENERLAMLAELKTLSGELARMNNEMAEMRRELAPQPEARTG